MARGQRVYGKSHPTRESIDLNLPALSSRGRAPLLSPGAPISRSGHAVVSKISGGLPAKFRNRPPGSGPEVFRRKRHGSKVPQSSPG